MRSTFWRNRILKRQSCQNRHTGLEFSPKRENSALSIKTVQNGLFRSCAARFGQNAFLSVKVAKIVTLAWNSLQNGKTVRFSWKLYKTLFSGHAQHVLAKLHLWASKLSKSSHWPEKLVKTGKECAFYENCTKRSFQVMRSTFWRNRILKRQLSKSSHWPQILSKTMKQCAFHKNCTKRAFQVMRSTFWPNRIFKRQSCQNRHTGLKFSPKRGKSALFMKIVQNARFRSYAAGFGQIAFVSVKVVKFVTLAWKARQNGKRVRFLWKLYKTLVSGHAQHVSAKLHFWESKLSKSSHWPEKLVKTGKGCAFYENCTKRSFQVMRSTFWPNRIFQGQTSQNR